jgi:hypothetical protein
VGSARTKDVDNYNNLTTRPQISSNPCHSERILDSYLHPSRPTTQARINVLHSESKQELSLEKEPHEERREAMAKEIEVRLKKAEMEKEKREQFLRGMIV